MRMAFVLVDGVFTDECGRDRPGELYDQALD